MNKLFSILLLFISFSISAQQVIRPMNFTVTPSTGPVSEVSIENRDIIDFSGELSVDYPDGWKVSPATQKVDLKAGEKMSYSFAIEQGVDSADNIYKLAFSLYSKGLMKIYRFDVVCASTPYYKPVIDGKLKEWADAIPIQFETKGKNTMVSTYWNNRNFCLAVEVEEDQLLGFKKASTEKGMDALQIKIQPGKSLQSESTSAPAYEFLFADNGGWWGKDRIFVLKDNEMREVAEDLADGIELSVSRKGSVTCYEAAIPMRLMDSLKATAGRDYQFSLLVHDPDGTGIRDLGSVMNLSDRDRVYSSWSSWDFVKWNGYRPYSANIEFGFCSSIH